MKLAVVQHVFRNCPTDLERFTAAKSLGLLGIEPDLSLADLADPNGARLAALLAARDATGLALPAVCMGEHNNQGLVFATWRGDQPAREIETAVRWAAKLHAGAVLVPFFFANEPRNAAQRKLVADTLRPLARLAESLQVKLCFEGPNPPAELWEIALAIDSPAFGIYYDCGNCAWMNRNPAIEAMQLHRLIHRVHLKDTIAAAGDARIGKGRVNLAEVAAALKSIGYDGWLTVEAFGLSPEALAADLSDVRKHFPIG
jgi:sugar phosphate isomerase/epimerase